MNKDGHTQNDDVVSNLNIYAPSAIPGHDLQVKNPPALMHTAKLLRAVVGTRADTSSPGRRYLHPSASIEQESEKGEFLCMCFFIES